MKMINRSASKRLGSPIAALILISAFMIKPLHAEPSPNLISGDSSFETGLGVLTRGFETGLGVLNGCGSWSNNYFKIDAAESLDGKQSLIVRGGIGSARIPTEPGKTYTFSLYARGKTNRAKARLYLINPEWRHTSDKEIILSKKWERYSLTIKARQSEYWLAFSAPDARVDACQFELGDEPTPYRNREPISVGARIRTNEYNYVFFAGEDVNLDLSVYKAWGAEKSNGFFSYRICDFLGTIVTQEESKIVLAKGEKFTRSLSLKPERTGLYVVRSRFKDGECLTDSPVLSFAVVKPPLDIAKGLEPFCGLNQLCYTGLSDLFRGPARIGANWSENIIKWSEVEPERDRFGWKQTDQIFDFKERGYKVTATLWLGRIPKWAWDPEEKAEAEKLGMVAMGLLPAKEHLRDWRNYVRATAARYKDAVDIWEIGGEDDLIWGRHPYYRKKYPESVTNSFVAGPVADRLGEVIAIAAQEIKKVNPRARIGAVRPSNADCNGSLPRFTFSREIFKRSRGELNVFPLDCYCHPPTYLGPSKDQPANSPPLEDILPEILNDARICAKEYGMEHVYISEFGWASDVNVPPDSIYAQDIVKRLSRTYLIARATPNLLFCRWFRIQGCREAGKYEYGLWRDGIPLPMVPAYSAVAGIVENVVESKKMDLGCRTMAVVFKKTVPGDGIMGYIRRFFGKDQTVGSVWMTRGEGKITIVSPEQIYVFDVMGNEMRPEHKDNETTFKIGEFPVYLEMNSSRSFKKLEQAVLAARLHVPPLEMSFTTPCIDKGILSLYSQVNCDLKANVSLEMPGKTITKELVIPMKKNASLSIPLSGEMMKETITAKADCGREFEKAAAGFQIEFEKCGQMTRPVKIDGGLSEWEDRPCILMDKRGQILPPDPWVSWSGTNDLGAKVYMGWDAANFYMAADVTDDKQFNNKTGSDIWNGDSIQLAFDPRADGGLPGKNGYNDDDYDLTIALTRDGPRAYEFAGPVKDLWRQCEYTVIRDETKKKTCYELKIPWKALNIKPKDGMVFGFNFVIFDDDEGAGQTYWYQLADGITNGKRPGMFKKFVLTK